MTLLLDTHAFLWWLDGSRKLGRRARRSIEAAEAAVWVSAATAWEIAIKVGLKKLALSQSFRPWMEKAIADLGVCIARVLKG